MKTFTEYLFFTTKTQKEIINITNQIQDIVAKSGVKDEMVLVSATRI